VRFRFWIPFVLIAAVALVLLTWHLGDAPWATDEPVYRNAAAAIYDYGNWTQNLEHPPLGKLVIGASMQLFGEHEAWAVRLPSALATLIGGALLAALAWVMLERVDRSRAQIAAVATFATWTLLPHPDPSFDVSRLGYLDALMTMFAAGALLTAWLWQRAWSWRWAVATGVLVGLALATKFPAAFVLAGVALLVVRRDDAPARRRALQLAALALVALIIALIPWLPLGADVPHALRFAVAMQRREVHQTIELAGHTYRDGAPAWAQLWWQWHAWPVFAILELIALIAAWWTLPRRAAVLVWATVLIPFSVFTAGGRILPHWQAAWQLGMAVLIGSMVGWCFTRARTHAYARVGGIIVVIVLLVTAGRAVQQRAPGESVQMRIASALAPADVAGGYVLDVGGAGIDRALTRALPISWDGTYHSAAYSQHDWIARDGGRPPEPYEPTGKFVFSSNTAPGLHVDDVTAVVTPEDVDRALLSIQSDDLREHYTRRQIGHYDVWLRSDLRR
jgi:4-amino-4-deoxy-L-arabinose transferase-like glycosyltransferase